MKVANESLRQHEVMAGLNLHLLLDRYKHLQYMPTRKRMTGKNNSCDEVTTLVKTHLNAFYMHHSGTPGERIDAMSVCDKIMAGVVKTLALKVESGLIAVESLHISVKAQVAALTKSSETVFVNKVVNLLQNGKSIGAKKLLKAYAYDKNEIIAEAIKAEGDRLSQRALKMAMRHGRKARIQNNLLTLKKMVKAGFEFEQQIAQIEEFYGITKEEQGARMQFSNHDASSWAEAKTIVFVQKLEKLPVLSLIVDAVKFVKNQLHNLFMKKQYRESGLRVLENSKVVSTATNLATQKAAQ